MRSLEITALRAQHRACTIRALAAQRERRFPWDPPARAADRLLAEAARVRRQALELVREQELHYRYPPELIAGQRENFTAYRFGYLYPVHSLFFWVREEEQVRNLRFDAFYMNIWNFRRIVGLESLCR